MSQLESKITGSVYSTDIIGEFTKTPWDATKKYFVAVPTAQATIFMPVLTTLETVCGFEPEIIEKTRLIGLVTTYLGLGLTVELSRMWFRKVFNTTQETSGKKKSLQDTIQLVSFTIPFSAVLYPALGANVEETAVGMLIQTGYAVSAGGAQGFMTDMTEDAYDYKDSMRVPEIFQNKSKRYRKNVLGGLFLMSMIYSYSMINANEYIPKIDLAEKVVRPTLNWLEENYNNVATQIEKSF